MRHIFNIYHVDQKDKKFDDYFIRFGNREEGWNCTKEELKEFWRKAVKSSGSRYYGDVSLMYRGKLIRSVNNFNHRLLDKEIRYKCMYNKYT